MAGPLLRTYLPRGILSQRRMGLLTGQSLERRKRQIPAVSVRVVAEFQRAVAHRRDRRVACRSSSRARTRDSRILWLRRGIHVASVGQIADTSAVSTRVTSVIRELQFSEIAVSPDAGCYQNGVCPIYLHTPYSICAEFWAQKVLAKIDLTVPEASTAS